MKPALDLKRYAPLSLEKVLPHSFRLLSWNVYKKLHRPKQAEYLASLLSEALPELMVFQESPSIISLAKSCSVLDQYEQYYFSNLTFKNKSFGLLNASMVESIHGNYVISKHKEFIFRTHKAFLVSLYPLVSGEILMLINVHAINFREVKIYQKELALLYDFASTHKGPLVIAGDFNSWGVRRLLLLDELMTKLKLKAVVFDHARLIKRFLAAPLDHILYRGVIVNKAHVMDCLKLSDHNPLYVEFLVSS